MGQCGKGELTERGGESGMYLLFENGRIIAMWTTMGEMGWGGGKYEDLLIY